jgi:hypothetical protein
MFIKTPEAAIVIIREVPPNDMNGSGIPFVGIMPMAMDIFIKA